MVTGGSGLREELSVYPFVHPTGPRLKGSNLDPFFTGRGPLDLVRRGGGNGLLDVGVLVSPT